MTTHNLSDSPDRLIGHILSFIKLWYENGEPPTKHRSILRLSPRRFSKLRKVLKEEPDLWAFVQSNIRYSENSSCAACLCSDGRTSELTLRPYFVRV
jgi:hypothetical protein